MLKREQGGTIVTVSSILGYLGCAGLSTSSLLSLNQPPHLHISPSLNLSSAHLSIFLLTFLHIFRTH